MKTFEVRVAGYKNPKYEEIKRGIYTIKGEEEVRTYTVQAETWDEATDIAFERAQNDKDFYPDEVVTVIEKKASHETATS